MHKYRLRAECKHDVDALARALKKRDAGAITTAAKDLRFPDCEVGVFTALSLSELREVIAGIEDGHVMLETVSAPDSYDGERRPLNA